MALDNHRIDDWKPYLFKTTDYGKTWTSVAGNLPAKGNINALREDYDNPDLLFVGTEFGLYVTLDGGKEWNKFMTGLPSVRVDDILIHPRDRDLIMAPTAVRSSSPTTSPRSNSSSCPEERPLLFEPRPAVEWKNDPQAQRHAANREFIGQNPQGGTAIHILAEFRHRRRQTGIPSGNQSRQHYGRSIKSGMNRFQWNMRGAAPASTGGRGGGGGGRGPVGPGVPFVSTGFGGPLVAPGTYMVRLTAGARTLTSSVTVLEDIWMRPQ